MSICEKESENDLELKYEVLLAVLQRALLGIGKIANFPDLNLIINEANIQGVQSFLEPKAMEICFR